MPTRKHFTASQKAKITLEILKEETTVNQIASKNGVHLNVLYRWKKQRRIKASAPSRLNPNAR